MSKVVLITGDSRGIGAATARLFARHGYDVCVNYRSNEAAAKQLQRELLAHGVRCIAVQADVAVGGDVKRLFDTVDAELGTLARSGGGRHSRERRASWFDLHRHARGRRRTGTRRAIEVAHSTAAWRAAGGSRRSDPVACE